MIPQFFTLLERHSGARTSGSGCDQLLLARPALLAFSTSVRFVLHVYTVLIWYSALPRHCLSLSECGKEVAQASVAHTTRTRAPSLYYLSLSLSLPLPLSLVSPVPHLSRQSEFIHDHGAFPRLRACERALLLEQTARQTIRACNRCNRSEARVARKLQENLGRPLRRHCARLSVNDKQHEESSATKRRGARIRDTSREIKLRLIKSANSISAI